jgi:hypothetical protein
LLGETALELLYPNEELQTEAFSVGETSPHAARAAAVDLATVLEEPDMWEGVEGGPNCTVTCNGKVSHCLDMLGVILASSSVILMLTTVDLGNPIRLTSLTMASRLLIK